MSGVLDSVKAKLATASAAVSAFLGRYVTADVTVSIGPVVLLFGFDASRVLELPQFEFIHTDAVSYVAVNAGGFMVDLNYLRAPAS